MKIAKRLALALLGLFVFAELVWLQLPPNRLGRNLEKAMQPLVNQYAIRLEVGALHPGWFGGEITEIKLYEGNFVGFEAQSISFSFAPWYLLRGALGLAGTLYEGEFSGHVGWLGNPSLYLKASNFAPGFHPVLRQRKLVNPGARLDAEADLTLNNDQLQGKLLLVGSGWVLQGKAKDTGLFFDLPQIQLQQLQMQADFSEMGAEVVASTKGDLASSLKGQIKYASLTQLLQRQGSLDLVLQAKPSAQWIQSLGDLSFILQSFQRPDGTIAGSLKGKLAFPQWEKQ